MPAQKIGESFVMQERSLVVFGHTQPDMYFMQFHRDLAREFGRLGWKVAWISPPCVRLNLRWWLSDLRSRLMALADGSRRANRKQAPRLLGAARARIGVLFNGALEREGTLWDFRPWGIRLVPHPGFRPLDELALNQMRRALHRLAISHPVVMLTAGHEVFFARRLAHDGVAFWVGDDSLAPELGRVHESSRALVESVADYADMVLAVSPVNFERLVRAHPDKTRRVGTGISLRRVAEADLSTPDELANLPRPLIGYAGSIQSDRFDAELLLDVARDIPEATFVLVGPIDEVLAGQLGAGSLGNLVVLGPRPYEQVLRYVQAFDVGVVPYLMNAFNLGSDPLKVYEYLALGKPVVSVPLPAVGELGDVVLLAEDSVRFAEQVRCAMVPSSPEDAARRRSVAAEHSVERIAAKLSEIFERGVGVREGNG